MNQVRLPTFVPANGRRTHTLSLCTVFLHCCALELRGWVVDAAAVKGHAALPEGSAFIQVNALPLLWQ